MEKFKADLDKLLSKYPDLGEFTIHISPRVKITSDIPTIKDTIIPPKKDNPKIEKEKKDSNSAILAMESSISKSRIEELKRISTTP